MANARGHYGKSSSPLRVGEAPTIYVERQGSSIGTWLLGAVALGGGLLWARHQSQQLARLSAASGVPYQSFSGSLRETARELPSRARAAYRGLTGRVRGPKGAGRAPASEAPALVGSREEVI